MDLINIHQAKTHLSRLVDLAHAGKEIVIAKAGKPMARLVMFTRSSPPRKKGLLKGKIRIQKAFDQPLPDDLLRTFEGQDQ